MRMLFPALLALSLFGCKDKEDPADSNPPDDSSPPDDSVPEVTDDDGDGYTLDEDCDDDDPDVNAGAAEICDGKDNDCDGETDEGGDTWHQDADGDGYGDATSSIQSCEQPDGYVADATDCDDGSALYHPGAAETDCADPADYNCDGSTGYEDGDGDGYAACQECDDGNPSANPDAAEVCDDVDNDCDGEADEADATGGSTWYADRDADGYGNLDDTTTACDAPDGFTGDSTDCDDTSNTVSPGATETCNDVDDDCDGSIDEAGADGESTWYADTDADGYGDPDSTVEACDQPTGYVAYDTDCDDLDADYNPGAVEPCNESNDYNCDGSVGYTDGDGDGWAACEECDDSDADINPDATEMCDEVDDDCDGQIDESDAADAATWYNDGDADGYGDPDLSTISCDAPAGYVADLTDCDDTNSSVSPGDYEYCNDIDDDCDGRADEEDAVDPSTWYTDADGDEWGDDGSAVAACDAPSGAIAYAGDCDDTDADVNPEQTEVCNEVDDDCDGYADDDASDAGTWYIDADADDYGDSSSTATACEQPSGYAGDGSDCDDADGAVYPGAEETCNGYDDDCDGSSDEEGATGSDAWYADGDGDGYGDAGDTVDACEQPDGYVADDTDCDDADLDISPAGAEVCNGYDDNCNGEIDETGDATEGTWYADNDGDGYGDASVTTTACEQPDGYVKLSTDCDDTDDTINPDAVDTCDGLDNDCSGVVDDGSGLGTTWYADADDDGYGDSATTLDACDQPAGYVADSTDCDDADGGVNPGADDVCDDLDNDCSGTADDDAVDATTWYLDLDRDGFGRANNYQTACDQPKRYVADNTDCNDKDATINPDADEVCDAQDNDCDDDIDEDTTDAAIWYEDADSDGYGDVDSTTTACDAPSGYVSEPTDCDDGDGDVSPGEPEVCNGLDDDCDTVVDTDAIDPATWYLDADGDGHGVSDRTTASCDQPTGYADNTDDCDDTDADVSPSADEVCNGADDDCDGTIDDGTSGLDTWYADMDGDGYGDRDVTEESCGAPTGYVDDSTDCDDADGDINPGATETCNSLDDDCDRQTDESGAVGESTWYADSDSDGYGDPDSSLDACDMPTGYVSDDSDCSDDDPDIFPGADEVCNGYDDDCNGEIDETGAASAGTWYADGDGDGYGDASVSTTSCDQPDGYVKLSTDCDDTDASVHPSATETCNEVDDDCDGTADDGASDAGTWYSDSDGDGYGDAAIAASACEQPAGYVNDDTDCDDGDGEINPGATEVCNDLDDDCDGRTDRNAADATTWYADADGDSYGDLASTRSACDLPSGYVATSTDCDDTDADVNPAASEVCNGLDDDCDGTTDTGATDGVTWYADSDSDGYGDETVSQEACDAPTGYVADDTDCDDSARKVNPGATETCNDVDDDCDSRIDDNASDATDWYADADGDGYGDETTGQTACDAPTGYIADSTDCDDGDGDVYPSATETCNDVDDDCDGSIDEGATDLVTWYADVDGDGYGDAETSTISCSSPSGYVSDGTDCADDDATMYPGATELCGDGYVNDCDGTEASALASCELSGSVALESSAWASLYGEGGGEYAGYAVSGAGDFNGDGHMDLAIGANRQSDAGTYAGAAYLWSTPVTGDQDIGDADGIYRGESAQDEAGQSIAGAWDVDGDGYDDVLIGAPKADNTGTDAGVVYLASGPHSGDLSLRKVADTLTGAVAGDVAGRSVSGVGDWDGDGENDVAVGAAGDDTAGSYSGKAYIVLGPVSGTTSLSTAYGEFTGEKTYDFAGRWISSGEDFDGDGLPDLLVGASGEDTGGSKAGAGYLVLGGSSGTVSLGSADAKFTGEKADDTAGRAVSFLGDLDGDGLSDLSVGAWGSDTGGISAGALYIYYSSSSVSGTSSLSTADTIVRGTSKTDYMGISVSSAGDVDGDGGDDLFIGAYGDDSGVSNGGAAYVWFGPISTGTFKGSSADIQYTGGTSSAGAGWAVAGVGDANGDGRDDLLIGAYKDSTSSSQAGAIYLIGWGY